MIKVLLLLAFILDGYTYVHAHIHTQRFTTSGQFLCSPCTINSPLQIMLHKNIFVLSFSDQLSYNLDVCLVQNENLGYLKYALWFLIPFIQKIRKDSINPRCLNVIFSSFTFLFLHLSHCGIGAWGM